MTELPIRRIILYKHGVGYFERRGATEGTSLQLSFPREAMDDVLKSLVAIDLGAGQVRGIDFETPEDRDARLARGSIHLSDNRSMLDMLRDLRGRRVRLDLREGSSTGTVEGLIIGVDLDEQRPLQRPFVSIYMPEQQKAQSIQLRSILGLEILDSRAADDLSYFLRASQSEAERRSATLRLSEGAHELLVGYVAPAPAWRVSYRVLAESTNKQAQSDTKGVAETQFSLLLQGWGLFDNQLEEDLNDVELTLVAGMPVSFRYQLYEPQTPERPLVQDEQRTVAAPVMFDAMAASAAPAPSAPAPKSLARSAHFGGGLYSAAPMSLAAEESMEQERGITISNTESTIQADSAGAERGSLFQYRVAHPISVGRGQSAMVPIVGQKLDGRKELLYNPQKLPRHPVASLRMVNTSDLTLERGPVTVLEEGDYAGEAVLPFTRPGAELIIAYAVELGVKISEQAKNERQLAGISVRNENFILQEWDISAITFTIHNTLEKAVDIVLETPQPASYELFETPAPLEQAQGMCRWSVTCAPGIETTFTVNWRRMLTRREQVRGVGDQQLNDYLRNRFLDQATFDKLSEVLAVYRRIAEHQNRIQQIAQERQAIYQRQQQTQTSLGPLGREGDEGKLRARYVALLEELENLLGNLGTEEQKSQEAIKELEQQARQMLKALSH